MWGALAKIGGAVLTGLGVDWAISSYNESQAAAEQQQKNINTGKVIGGAAAIYLGYLLLKKLK